MRQYVECTGMLDEKLTEKSRFGPLARRGYRVVSLESGQLGIGPSKRRGGIALPLGCDLEVHAAQWNRVGALEIDKCENKLWRDASVPRNLSSPARALMKRKGFLGCVPPTTVLISSSQYPPALPSINVIITIFGHAGRFSAVKKTEDNTVSFFINCNNAGVEFIHASAPSTRSRLNPPIPEEYFGNALHFKKVKTSAGELLKNGLGWAAMQINKMVVAQNTEEVVKMYKDWVENPILITKGSVYGGITKLAIGSTPRHNIYSTDFGWGKPIGVRSGMPNKSDGKITLFPGAKEGSVDIEVCLLSETLKALENDKEFMEAVTKK
ncbi:hypothetical protein BC332_20487 [Capsicum chinense]|nr:hypothetical protein BC332_20487 [Capsicum chinense]